MVALVFVPSATTRDPGKIGRTSFRHIYEVLCKRTGRSAATDPNEKFERIYLATYDEREGSPEFGALAFTEIIDSSRAANAPQSVMTFEDVVREIGACYLVRNPKHRSRS